MEYEDRVSISTPEGIEIDLALAGIGSRMSARILDFILQVLIGGVIALILGAIVGGLSGSSELGIGMAAGSAFFSFLLYDVLFETYREGQTPGKKRLGIRVLGDGGEPVSFRAAMVRNVLRLIDEWATIFLAALISMVRSPRNQRLGDIAGGTIVVGVGAAAVGERITSSALGSELTVSLGALPVLERARSWDTSAISADELDAIRQFLTRRTTLLPGPRQELASRLATRARGRIVGLEPDLPDEWVLEIVAALRGTR
jgi:uncharacterized RDD family membrane protein YckC